MNTQYKHIFTPIQLNKLILKNRIFASSGVHAGDIHHGVEVSNAGVSMLCTCMSDVACEKSYFYPNTTYQFAKERCEEMKARIRRVHQGGAKYVLEMSHVGEYYRPEVNDFAWGTQDKFQNHLLVVKALQANTMDEIADAYAKTAMDAVELGFDALLFDCSAGWLMSQFLSPHYNSRKDEYGGKIENRARFPMQVITKIRSKVGKEFPIFIQVCVNEYFHDGIEFHDVIAFLKMIEPYVDCVFAICGNDQNHIQMTKLVATNLQPHMINAGYTQQLKKELNIPIALLGSVMSAQEAERAIANGMADLIGLSRPLIADPCFVQKLIRNCEEDIVPCIRCNQCFHVASDYKYVACSVNPLYTQQKDPYVTTPAVSKKKIKIVVVGAGPAGIRAALAADQCGHEVILIEKENEIGGMLRFISKEYYKEDIARYYRYLGIQLKKSKVHIMLNTDATQEMLKKMKPDRVIIAIGAKERKLCIEGINQDFVYVATQAIANVEKLGNNVVIIGGGTVGVELALELGMKQERKIVVVEASETVASSANTLYQLALKEQMKLCPNINVLLATTCMKILKDCIVVNSCQGEASLPIDTVILAIGFESKTVEAFALFGVVEDTIMIGDVNKPRNIIDATYEGYTSGVYTL